MPLSQINSRQICYGCLLCRCQRLSAVLAVSVGRFGMVRRELGISGVRARGRVDQIPTSLGNGFFRTRLRLWHDSFRMKDHRHDDGQQHQKNETILEGCETSTIMLIHHMKKATWKPIATMSDTNDPSIWRANLATRNTSAGFLMSDRPKSIELLTEWLLQQIARWWRPIMTTGVLSMFDIARRIKVITSKKRISRITTVLLLVIDEQSVIDKLDFPLY